MLQRGIAIIVKNGLAPGLIGNICACIGTGIHNIDPELIGHDIEREDIVFKAITKTPIIIVDENKKGMKALLRRARKKRLQYVLYEKQAVGATDYDDYGKKVKDLLYEELDILGIGIVGEKELVKKVIGDLPLVR